MTRKDSFDKSSVHRALGAGGGGDAATRSPSQSFMMLGGPNGSKSNSFSGLRTDPSIVSDVRRLSGSSSPDGSSSSVINSAINSARMAMGTRSNSFSAFVAASLNASSDKDKLEDEKDKDKDGKVANAAAGDDGSIGMV